MASFIYPNYLKLCLSGTIDLINDPIYVTLVSGSYIPNTGHTLHSSISGHEILDPLNGYQRPGQLLAGKTISVTNGYTVFDASDVTWTSATINCSGAVIWYSGATPSSRYLIHYTDIGSNSSTNGTFQIQWNNTYGVFRLIGS